MGKITERNTDQSTAATWGSVSISPTDDVIVGSYSTWTVTFTVGAYAMDVGGGLKIGTRRQADFGHPQFDDPAADNYASVTCSRDGARFETYFDHRGHKRPFNAVVVIRLATGPLYPGDTITVVLGDTSGGSRGLAVQTFPESASDFAVFMDPISSGELDYSWTEHTEVIWSNASSCLTTFNQISETFRATTEIYFREHALAALQHRWFAVVQVHQHWPIICHRLVDSSNHSSFLPLSKHIHASIICIVHIIHKHISICI